MWAGMGANARRVQPVLSWLAGLAHSTVPPLPHQRTHRLAHSPVPAQAQSRIRVLTQDAPSQAPAAELTASNSAIACSWVAGFLRPRPSSGLYVLQEQEGGN